MRKLFLGLCLLCAGLVMAETTPIFYESFNKCKNDEDLKGYTGGNDGQWGGDIAKAIVVYTDNKDWEDGDCNGADQCVKVGLSGKGGSITTPSIACNGDIKLTFHAAPWIASKEDSVITVSVTSGEIDATSFTLNTKKWNDISIKIYNVENSVKITFKSGNKNRFFLDEVKVFPSDPDDASLKVTPMGNISFGTLGKGYSQQSKQLTIESANITDAGVTVKLDDEQSAFELDKSKLTSTGGVLTVSCKTGKPAGNYSCKLTISAVSAKDASEKLEKTIYLGFSVANITLQGAGTKENPYTVNDLLALWDEWLLFENEWHWVRGYVLGGASTGSGSLSGVSKVDQSNIVLAASATETSVSNMLPVQIKGDAQADLNAVNNPELIGKEVFVYGQTATYLGQLGLKGVQNEDQYVRDPKTTTNIHTISANIDLTQPLYDILGRRVGADYHGIVIQAGKKWLQ